MVDSKNTLNTPLTTKLAAAAMTYIMMVEIFLSIQMLPYCSTHSVRLKSCRREPRQSTRKQN